MNIHFTISCSCSGEGLFFCFTIFGMFIHLTVHVEKKYSISAYS